jgi:hypothetical protein
MSTETQTQATPAEVAAKVTFTPEQQSKIEDLIKDAMGRAGKQHQATAEKTKTELDASRTELAAAKAELDQLKGSGQSAAAITGQKEEHDRLKAEYDRQLAELKSTAESRKAEADRNKQEFEALRRTQAIQEATGEIGFYKPSYVSALTEDKIKWDGTRNRFVVLNEHGTERMNSAYEPMSLKEFYQEYASENPFMVKGSTASGSGSTQSAGLSSNGQFKVEDIFGAKSNTKAANDLARTNINEYHRLKAIAKSGGLI